MRGAILYGPRDVRLEERDDMGTGWFAADAAIGAGAAGLLGALSAKQIGAERIGAMSRYKSRQKLARERRAIGTLLRP